MIPDLQTRKKCCNYPVGGIGLCKLNGRIAYCASISICSAFKISNNKEKLKAQK